jgi:DNA-binding response OmpR family regulator
VGNAIYPHAIAHEALMKILWVEDNPVTATLLIRILTFAGYEVTHTAYGLEGMKFARQGRFDLILLDFKLPDIDGSQICLALRDTLKSTPILAVTSDNDRVTRRKAQAFGFNGFITKPIDIEEFLHTIGTYSA